MPGMKTSVNTMSIGRNSTFHQMNIVDSLGLTSRPSW